VLWNKKALVKDKRNPNLFLLAASQTRDKTALTVEGVEEIIEELRKSYDYIVCDSPAGIESGSYSVHLHYTTSLLTPIGLA
jgi:septum site-determining protein MinD